MVSRVDCLIRNKWFSLERVDFRKNKVGETSISQVDTNQWLFILILLKNWDPEYFYISIYLGQNCINWACSIRIELNSSAIRSEFSRTTIKQIFLYIEFPGWNSSWTWSNDWRTVAVSKSISHSRYGQFRCNHYRQSWQRCQWNKYYCRIDKAASHGSPK